jgi:general secretion pathway protein A
MLCRSLLETFEARTFLCVVLDPRLTVDDLLRQVLTDFGLLTRPDPGVGAQSPPSRHQLVSTLQQFLASLVPLNAHAVVMIDEAQQLDPALLEQIRLLSNFETDEAKLLQIVLVGQPDLDALLQRPDMRQLNQRVARRAELYPLSPDEVGDYIRRRLAVAAEPPPGVTPISPDGMAGGRVPIEITAEAAAAIATLSAGIPRVVNTLSDRTLEVGYERQTRVLDETIVATAAERLKLAAPAPIAATETALETNAPAVTAYEPPQAVEAAIRGGLPIGKFAAAACVAAAVGGIAWLGWTRASTGRPAVGFARPAATAPGPAPAAREPAATAPPAATTPPSAAPPSPAVPAVTYHITVAAFRTAQRASSVAASLKERGLPMYTRLDPTSEWRLVIAGPFKSTADAAAAQQTLAAEGFSDTRVVADE